MMKPFASGHAARNGVLTAKLVKNGFTAAADAVEDHRGFLKIFADGGTRDVNSVLATWGAPFDVGETSIGIKRYPCCGIIHSSLDVLGKLIKDEGLTEQNVESIDVALITQRLHHINRPNPNSPIEGKFSIQYCLASLLRHGVVNLGTFTDSAIQDPATRALMARVNAGVHADVKPTARRQEGGTEIVVTTRDGRQIKAGASKALGRVPGEPLPDSMVDDKFLDCVSTIVAPLQAQRALDMLRGLEGVASVNDMTRELTPRSSETRELRAVKH
jgi:2-methylcitrate dehydratase PrpD